MDAPESSADPLAAALLPVLLHRIRNTTQLVSSLNEVLSMDALESPARAEPLGRGGHLAAAAREADELGWLLGVLAGGLGADLLLRRCEPRGLALALELVQEALRREGVELALPDELPRLTPEVPGHGELCWLAAHLTWSAARRADARLELTVESRNGTWELAVPAAPAPPVPPVEERLAGAELRVRDGNGGGEWRLTLPGPWLR